MKQKDIALIAVIVVVSAIFSFIVSGAIFSSPQKRQMQAEEVQAITSNFPEPDTKYFNDQSVNPTREITIGDNSNPDPFSGSNQ